MSMSDYETATAIIADNEGEVMCVGLRLEMLTGRDRIRIPFAGVPFRVLISAPRSNDSQ